MIELLIILNDHVCYNQLDSVNAGEGLKHPTFCIIAVMAAMTKVILDMFVNWMLKSVLITCGIVVCFNNYQMS